MTHKNDRVLSVKELARVEGEGALYLRASGNRVEEARLDIYEPPRFFEAFLRGRAYTEPLDITARICGICSVAYQMSACQAIEDACGVTVPGPVADLRRLLYCGEWIESHALHIYLLHAPDFLGYRSGIEMATARRDIVERGLALKKAGNAIMEVVGGRAIHPVNVRLGGFYRAPARAELAALTDPLRRALDDALATVAWVAGFDFPDHAGQADMLALRRPGTYPIERGTVATRSGLAFPAADWDEYVIEEQVPHSTALHAHLAGAGRYLTGPLARYSLNSRWLSPLAREAARAAGLGPACDNPFRSIVVRAVETVYAVDEALRLIEAYEPPDPPAAGVPPRAGVGRGVTEAPRGTLYHRYEIGADGLIASARIVPPTSQNQAAIEADLRAFAEARLGLDDAELTRQCEQAIRNYDPCISCSAHFLDLTVERSLLISERTVVSRARSRLRAGHRDRRRQRVPPRRRCRARRGRPATRPGTARGRTRHHRRRTCPADRGLDRGGARRGRGRGTRPAGASGPCPPFRGGPACRCCRANGELARLRPRRRDRPGRGPEPDARPADRARDRSSRPDPGHRPDPGRRRGRGRRGGRHPRRHRRGPPVTGQVAALRAERPPFPGRPPVAGARPPDQRRLRHPIARHPIARRRRPLPAERDMASYPTDHAGLEILPFDRCLRLLATVPVGRVSFFADGEIVVLPVNHVMDGANPVFRTARGSKLSAAEGQNLVAFEADEYDERTQSGWSVLVTGRVEVIDEQAEIRRLTRLGLRPWATAVNRPFWIRIRPSSITGRQTPTAVRLKVRRGGCHDGDDA